MSGVIFLYVRDVLERGMARNSESAVFAYEGLGIGLFATVVLMALNVRQLWAFGVVWLLSWLVAGLHGMSDK